MDQNEQNKQDLISLLKEKRALLFVGAGSSAFAGYPTWKQLLSKLAEEFAPRIAATDPAEYADLADQIKESAEKSGRLEEYHKFLECMFQHRATGVSHTQFHAQLVNLGFSGVVTLNYDLVLESAITEASHAAGCPIMPETIDLCAEGRQYRVFRFLRSIRPADCHTCVLHLHGCCNNPRQLILTREEYLRAYEGRRSKADAELLAMVRERQGSLSNARFKEQDRVLGTLHRKVIWSLLAVFPLVFVGFGMTDQFFLDILRIVQSDLALYSEPAHFALMGCRSDEDRETKSRELGTLGVRPVYYHVPEPQPPVGDEDHRGLLHLVSELADSVGVTVASPTIDQLSKRMWSRVDGYPAR